MMQENQQLPPPLPGTYRRPVSYGLKIFLMGVMCFFLMFGVLAIWLVSYSRGVSNNEVAEEIYMQWGRTVHIEGPMVVLENDSLVCPTLYDCQAEVNSKSLHRNIYEAEVYTANLKMSGTYTKESLRQDGDTVVIQLEFDTREIVNLHPLKIGGKSVDWQQDGEFLLAKVDLTGMPETINFSTQLELRGSEDIYIQQAGDKSTITISGLASNPSYVGAPLPIERSQTDDGKFSAKWVKTVPEKLAYSSHKSYVGVKFLVGVDRYHKVDRSLKYSFIIIILTFLSVLFVEIMRKRPIPLLNYFLIGAALIIFYSLLLSFVELIAFGYAYLIASVMTVALITGYMWKMLGSRKLGLSIGGILSLMYLFCYIMLIMSTYALLFGSLLLFFTLAAMMYASLKLKRT